MILFRPWYISVFIRFECQVITKFNFIPHIHKLWKRHFALLLWMVESFLYVNFIQNIYVHDVYNISSDVGAHKPSKSKLDWNTALKLVVGDATLNCKLNKKMITFCGIKYCYTPLSLGDFLLILWGVDWGGWNVKICIFEITLLKLQLSTRTTQYTALSIQTN